MSSRQALKLLFAVTVLALSTAEAKQLRLVRSQRKSIPGEAAQAGRFLQSYPTWQTEQPPLQRFRFRPTDTDVARISRLQAGGVDTVRVLCLRVEFQTDTTPLTTGNGKMDTLGFLSPDSGLFYDPPHFKRYFERQMEGLRNYYRAQSLGKLYVDYTVMPSGEKDCYQLPREMQFYGDTISYDAIEVGLVRLMSDAFKVADDDPEIHFGDYDEFIVFHAGSGLQSDYGLRNDSPFDLLAGEIPSGAIQAYLGVPYISVDSGRTRIEQGTVLPEMMRQDTMYGDETNILGMTGLAGTLFHEFAHLLGAYDLYDVTGWTMGVGGWSLMGYGSWLGEYGAGAPPGVIPGFLDAYHRTLFLDTITQVRTVRAPLDSILVYAAAMDTELFGLRSDTQPTIVKIPITPDEYFLIENRQVDVKQPDTIDVDVEDGVVIAVGGNEYDFFQPGSGLLIWHIDRKVLADYGPYNAVNIDPTRKGVDLEEGDGVQDFDVSYWQSRAPSYEVYGYKYDPFSKGGYNDRFTDRTSPNSDGYTGRSYLDVTLLGVADSTSRLKDTIIPVKVGWDLYQPGFPKIAGNTPLLSAFAADMDGDDSLEIAVVDTAGGLKIWRANGSTVRALGLGYTTRSDIAIGDVSGDSRLEVVAAGNDTLVTVVPVSGTPSRIKVGDRVLAAPVLADLDGDGKKEIIVGSTDMKLYAWKGDGTLMPGFPVAVGSEIRAPVAVTTDTVPPQIVLLSGDGRLLLYNSDGSLADSLTLSSSPFYATAQPLVGDFDRDGSKEIAVIAGGEHDYRFYLVGLNGTVKYQSGEFIRSPFTGVLAAADVNADEQIDFLAASINELFALNRNATLVTNYPFTQESTYTTTELAGNWIITFDVLFQYASSPVVADVDGDGAADVVIGSPQYGLLGFDGRTGEPLEFFPLMATAGISAVPLAADLDRDGDIELAAGSDSGVFYVWDMPGPASGIKWPCAYHDPCHTGLVPDSEVPVWQPGSSTKLVDKLYVYPNPAADEAKVRYRLGPGQSVVQIRLLDMVGEPVGGALDGQAVPGMDNETVVRLAEVPPGTYIVRLAVTNSGKTEVKFTKLAVVR